MQYPGWSSLKVLTLLTLLLFLAGFPKSSAGLTPSGRALSEAPAAPPGRVGAAVPPSAEGFISSESLKDIYFDFDRADISPAATKILEENARWLKANPRYLVLIEGHSDERGTRQYNLALGERRAMSVRASLVSSGVAADRITAISYGDARPVCADKTEACWAQNRRAYFLVKPLVAAPQDLQGGIQDLVRQMIASMEQQQKRKLAILDFTKLDGSVDNFGRYLAERLITALFLTRAFEVIERRQLDKILAELKRRPSDLVDPENAKRLGTVSGVDAIASGSVTELEAIVEVNARLIETETGRVFAVAATRFAKDKDVVALMRGSPEARPRPSQPVSPAAPWAPAAGMELISAGPFIYGEEGKEQTISLPAFYMDLYEVTNAEYARVLPLEYPPEKANHPVVNISWYHANRYCEAVGKRLPSEQEWEKAARGTDGRRYPWGDTYRLRRANGDRLFGGTTPVGEFPAGRSPYGLFDMAGNVWEWTSSGEGMKVLRGGSWLNLPLHLRGAERIHFSPDNQFYLVGFRCAREFQGAWP